MAQELYGIVVQPLHTKLRYLDTPSAHLLPGELALKLSPGCLGTVHVFKVHPLRSPDGGLGAVAHVLTEDGLDM